MALFDALGGMPDDDSERGSELIMTDKDEDDGSLLVVSWCPLLKGHHGHHVLVPTDNATVVACINRPWGWEIPLVVLAGMQTDSLEQRLW